MKKSLCISSRSLQVAPYLLGKTRMYSLKSVVDVAELGLRHFAWPDVGEVLSG